MKINIEAWAKWLKVETFGEQGLENLVSQCANFATALTKQEHPRWISLLGTCGTGKTHCAVRLWDLRHHLSWTRTLYDGHIVYWPRFVVQLRERVREGVGCGEFLDMGHWPLLVLDDIGAERDPTGFATEHLNLLLGMRVGKWTVLTSNLALDQLAKIDDRIASRMVRERGNIVVEMRGTRDFGTR